MVRKITCDAAANYDNDIILLCTSCKKLLSIRYFIGPNYKDTTFVKYYKTCTNCRDKTQYYTAIKKCP